MFCFDYLRLASLRNQSDFKIVEALAQYGSIRKAAEAVALTPSALNRKLLAMEDEFRVQMFDRTSLGLRLNASGELVVENARKQQLDLEVLKSDLATIKHARTGHIRICASQAAMEAFLPREMVVYKRRFPEVTFALHYANAQSAQAALQEYHSDLALCFNLQASDIVEIIGEITQSLYAMIPIGHPILEKEEIIFEDLAATSLALPSQGSGLRSLLDKKAASIGLNLKCGIESSSFLVLKEMSLSLGMIGFRQALSYANYENYNGFELRKVVDLDPITSSLAKLKGRTTSEAIRGFCGQIQTTCNASKLDVEFHTNY